MTNAHAGSTYEFFDIALYSESFDRYQYEFVFEGATLYASTRPHPNAEELIDALLTRAKEHLRDA